MYYKAEDRLNELLKRDATHRQDVERKALFYILASNLDLYNKIDYIYDFNNHSIKSECLENEHVDFCSSARSLIKLAFNLYNGANNADVLGTFSNLDESNFKIAINALKVRFDVPIEFDLGMYLN